MSLNHPSHKPSTPSEIPFEEWKLTAYVLNELDSADREEVERLLSIHARWRQEVESLRNTIGQLEDALVPVSPHAELTSTQKTTIQKAMASNANHIVCSEPANIALPRRSVDRSKRRRRRVLAALLATAACIPVGFLGWWTWSQRTQNQQAWGIQFESAATESVVASKTLSSSEDRSLEHAESAGKNPSLVTSDNARQNLDATKHVVNSTSGDATEVASTQVHAPDGGSILVGGIRRGPDGAVERGGKNKTESNKSFGLEASRGSSAGMGMGSGGYGSEGSTEFKRISTNPGSGSFGPGMGSDKDRAMSGMDGMPGMGSGGMGGGGMGGAGGGMPGMGGPGMGGSGMGPGMGMGSGMGSGAMGSGSGDASGPGASAAGGWGRSASPPPNLSVSPRMIVAEEEVRIAGHSRRTLPPELKDNLRSQRGLESKSGDRFETIVETPFVLAETAPVTTFSIDVDTASYGKMRQMIQQARTLPAPDMIRIEEMINYFEYEYPSPVDDKPFSAEMKLQVCPWNSDHLLLRVGLQAQKLAMETRPPCNLVFLIDVSGSMDQPNKLPLVQRTLSILASRLRTDDRVAIVVYAGAAGCVLESTPGHQRDRILSAIENLRAGGSTNGGQGIQLAYQLAKENFIEGGANRVILCTDGDFNVGTTSTESLVEMVKGYAKSNVFLTCLGYGMGNYNDDMMEKIAKDGNGVHGVVDTDREARRLMVEQMQGTLVTVAKDVKIQMDFNPELVQSYRLIGYENRALTNADFSNDKKDAGDIGAGHTVTALYEIVPRSRVKSITEPQEGEGQSKYAKPIVKNETISATPTSEFSNEWLTLKIRYKQPQASESTKLEFVLKQPEKDAVIAGADSDSQWAAAVAEFGLLLRQSQYAPEANWDRMIERASGASNGNEHREECVSLMRAAKQMANRVGR
jgi:Ca-activated chloride channel homolog